MTPFTTQQIKDRLSAKYGDTLNFEHVEYVNMHTKVKVVCPKHGINWSTPANLLLPTNKTGCRQCGRELIPASNTYSQEEFVQKVIAIYGDVYDTSHIVYKGCKHKVTLVCKKHGEFSKLPPPLLLGHGCKKCGWERIGDKCRLSLEEIQNRSKEKFGDVFYFSPNNKITWETPITIICKTHGAFKQTPASHLTSRYGCPKCGRATLKGAAPKSTEKVAAEVRTICGDKYTLIKYVPSNRKTTKHTDQRLILLCKEHGEFSINKSLFKEGYGCPLCAELHTSKWQTEISDFIKLLYKDEIKENARIYTNLKQHCDIYFPKLSLAIECNGLYWHSSAVREGTFRERDSYAKTRHIEKHEDLLSKGIRLVQIWEDEWMFNQEVTKKFISSLLGIGPRYFARKCVVSQIDKTIGNDFLTTHHMQGKCSYATVFYGLHHESKLVAVMAFGIATSVRGNTDTSMWELMRFASDGRVAGGGSRLLTAFEKDHPQVTTLISYCDRRLFTGGSYYKYGFQQDTTAKIIPDYCTIKGLKRCHKSYTKKSSLKSRYNLTDEDMKLTELEICDILGIPRIYDCGKIKFIKTYSPSPSPVLS